MTQPQRLAQVFVELADTLTDAFDVVEFLQMLTERCVEVLEADASGLMLEDSVGHLQLVAATAEKVRLLDLFELQISQGPCIECHSTGAPVVNVDATEAARRWPMFAQGASAAGFASTHALPMRLRGRVIGALNLFCTQPTVLTDEDVAVGQAMADIATIGLLHERSSRDQSALAGQLQTALDSRIVIEQAKGVLAERAGTGVNEAFTSLRRYARSNGTALTTVASLVVEGTLRVDALTS